MWDSALGVALPSMPHICPAKSRLRLPGSWRPDGPGHWPHRPLKGAGEGGVVGLLSPFARLGAPSRGTRESRQQVPCSFHFPHRPEEAAARGAEALPAPSRPTEAPRELRALIPPSGNGPSADPAACPGGGLAEGPGKHPQARSGRLLLQTWKPLEGSVQLKQTPPCPTTGLASPGLRSRRQRKGDRSFCRRLWRP